jgi:predicted DNA-binding transcriptional regulator YafY
VRKPGKAVFRLFQTLTRALRQHRAVKFKYRKWGQREVLARRALPYHLACIDNHWYMFAHDFERKATRTFALSRVTEPELTKQSFTPTKKFSPNRYLKDTLAVMKGEEDHVVVIEFDSYGTDLVRHRKWHGSQEFTELPGGGSQLRMRLSGLEEIERSVLNWGTHATVIEPKALADRIRKTAQAIAGKYG